MRSVIQDIGYAFRALRGAPGFAVPAALTLALGLGANTVIFSVISKVLLDPLPYYQPERLVKLGRQYPRGYGWSNSIPKYMVWRHNSVFSAMAIYDAGGPGLNLSTGDRPEQVPAHERAIAVRIRRRQADEFVEVERGRVEEIDQAGAMQPHQLAVEGNGRPTGRKTEHQPRIAGKAARDITGQQATHGVRCRMHADAHQDLY